MASVPPLHRSFQFRLPALSSHETGSLEQMVPGGLYRSLLREALFQDGGTSVCFARASWVKVFVCLSSPQKALGVVRPST